MTGQKRKLKVFVDQIHLGIGTMLNRNGYVCTKTWDDTVDIVLFSGGEDVHPFLYGEKLMTGTYTNIIRDRKDNRLFRIAQRAAKPCVGICRGAQLLNVLSGGSLWQDVNNHGKSHPAFDFVNKRELLVTSTHHQMMRPAKDALWVAGARSASKLCCENSYIHHKVERGPNDWNDPEVVYISRTNSLCFQPHPEFDNKICESYFFECMERYIQPTIKKVLHGSL